MARRSRSISSFTKLVYRAGIKSDRIWLALSVLLGMIWIGAGTEPAAAQAFNAASVSGQVSTPYGSPAISAQVRVCPVTSGGVPCAAPATLYSDYNLTSRIPNPVATDQYGNYKAFVPAGLYLVQVTLAGGQTQPVYTYYVSAGAGGALAAPPSYAVQYASSAAAGQFGADAAITINPTTHTTTSPIFYAPGGGTGQVQLGGATSGNYFTQTVDPSTGAWTFTWPTVAPSPAAPATFQCLAGNGSGVASWQNCPIGNYLPIPGGTLTGPLTAPSVAVTSGLTAGSVTASTGTISTLTSTTLNNVEIACQFPGAPDAAAQIRAAWAALPATGGVVDARCYQGLTQLNSNMAAGAPAGKPITVLLGSAPFLLAASGAQQAISSTSFAVVGTGLNGSTVEWQDTTNDIFAVSGAQDILEKLNIIPAPGSNPTPGCGNASTGCVGLKTAGYIINTNGSNNATVRDIQMTDPWQGIFIQNSLQDRFEDIYFYTTTIGTLYNGIYLYGLDIDDFLTNIYGVSSWAVPASFLHLRNRASGIRFDNLSWESNGSGSGVGGTGILLDCGTSPTLTATTACTETQGLATSRPELLHFDKVYIESTYGQPAINIAGGQDIVFHNFYLATSLQAITVAGEATGITFDGGYIGNMYQQCVLLNQGAVSGPGYANFSLTHTEINNCSQAATQTYAAIELGGGGVVNNVNIQGNHIGHNTFPSFANDSAIGVKLDGQSNYVRVVGNDFVSQFSNTTAILTTPIYVANSAGSVGNVFADNTSFSTGGGSVPYSTVSRVSAAGCTFSAGTVGTVCTVTFAISQPDTNYSVNGCNVANAVAGPAYVGSISTLTASSFQVLETAGNIAATGGGTVICDVVHQ